MALLIFFILNLVMVILSTIRSVLTIKAGRMTATIINAISCGFYVLIIKQMTGFSTLIVVVVTVISNIIGVYFSLWLLDKTKKDKLWVVNIPMNQEDSFNFCNLLKSHEIGFTLTYIVGFKNYNVNVAVYCYSQKESGIVADILSHYDCKYHILQSKTSF